ncbi:MAG: 2-oxoacid:acceptor oxidoreductase subunit alpha, partial [Bacteroidales bacterium]
KAMFTTNDPFAELGLNDVQILSAPISSMTKSGLEGYGLDNKSALRCKNMFALGLICWLFNRPIDSVLPFLKKKFSKKEAIMQANIKVLTDGYNFGANTHASVSTYKIEPNDHPQKGFYTDINGNTATAYGLIAAAEKAGLPLFLGSYPITPATDILHELAKRKDLGVKTVQCEDEISGICTAIGASFAGNLAATTTSGPGLALKGEAIGLAVMAEIPLVIVDVQRGGPSTGLPTKTEQSDLMQALYGRNGESPAVVIAAKTPTNCFDMAYMSSKIALEHMTPVILLTDGFIANGSSAWKIPNLSDYPEIKPPFVPEDLKGSWKPYQRDEETKVRYWAVPGREGFEHRIGGLEKDYKTGAISTDPLNHQIMTDTRQAKIGKIADFIPELQIEGNPDSDTLVVGWGGTYGHLSSAVDAMNTEGKKVAHVQFEYINPLPKNTEEILRKYKNIIVCELNLGQFVGYLRMQFPSIDFKQYNKVQGQPFMVSELVDCVTKFMEEK